MDVYIQELNAKIPPEKWFSILTTKGTDGRNGMKSPGACSKHRRCTEREANQNEANEK
jgi:hypothetical protein